MTIEKQSESDSDMSTVNVAIKVVQALLATIAAYRAARSAITAWQGIRRMLRDDVAEPDA